MIIPSSMLLLFDCNCTNKANSHRIHVSDSTESNVVLDNDYYNEYQNVHELTYDQERRVEVSVGKSLALECRENYESQAYFETNYYSELNPNLQDRKLPEKDGSCDKVQQSNERSKTDLQKQLKNSKTEEVENEAENEKEMVDKLKSKEDEIEQEAKPYVDTFEASTDVVDIEKEGDSQSSTKSMYTDISNDSSEKEATRSQSSTKQNILTQYAKRNMEAARKRQEVIAKARLAANPGIRKLPGKKKTIRRTYATRPRQETFGNDTLSYSSSTIAESLSKFDKKAERRNAQVKRPQQDRPTATLTNQFPAGRRNNSIPIYIDTRKDPEICDGDAVSVRSYYNTNSQNPGFNSMEEEQDNHNHHVNFPSLINEQLQRGNASSIPSVIATISKSDSHSSSQSRELDKNIHYTLSQSSTLLSNKGVPSKPREKSSSNSKKTLQLSKRNQELASKRKAALAEARAAARKPLTDLPGKRFTLNDDDVSLSTLSSTMSSASRLARLYERGKQLRLEQLERSKESDDKSIGSISTTDTAASSASRLTRLYEKSKQQRLAQLKRSIGSHDGATESVTTSGSTVYTASRLVRLYEQGKQQKLAELRRSTELMERERSTDPKKVAPVPNSRCNRLYELSKQHQKQGKQRREEIERAKAEAVIKPLSPPRGKVSLPKTFIPQRRTMYGSVTQRSIIPTPRSQVSFPHRREWSLSSYLASSTLSFDDEKLSESSSQHSFESVENDDPKFDQFPA